MWLHDVRERALGNDAEVRGRALQEETVTEVLQKVDGQMIGGTLIGEQVEFWSRVF